MLKKLKSVLKIPLFPLLLKTACIFLLFTWLSVSPFKVYPLLAFIIFSILFYFLPLLNAFDFLGYFLIFLFGSLVTILSLTFSPLTLMIIFGLTVIFFLLIGAKNLNLSQQSIFLLRSLLFLLIFLIFFSVDKSQLFFLKYLLLIIAIYILFFGLFRGRPKQKLFALAFSFLSTQIIWAIGLLPIGFINQASLALVFVLTIEEFSLLHFGGNFNYQNIAKNLIIVIILIVFILGLSKWNI